MINYTVFIVVLVIMMLVCACTTQEKPQSLIQLEVVNQTVNRKMYLPDSEQFGVEDYWQHPEEFNNSGKGDCEDFAILKAHLLAEGYYNRNEEDLMFYILTHSKYKDHMVLVVDGYVLDNFVKKVLPFPKYLKQTGYEIGYVMTYSSVNDYLFNNTNK